MKLSAHSHRVDDFGSTGSPPGDPSATLGVEHEVQLPGPRRLSLGGLLPKGTVRCWTSGVEDGIPVVVLGGISAGRRADRWWSEFVGDGLPVDTRRVRVIGVDWLGHAGSRSEAVRVTAHDEAVALATVLDHLEVELVGGIVGSSYGGAVALAFAERFPDRASRLLVICAAHRPHPLATALRSIQRKIVRLGLETGAERRALELARGLAMTTYRTAAEFDGRFSAAPDRLEPSPTFPVESYLEARGRDFADRVHPRAFLALSEALDLSRIDPRAITTPTTLVSFDSDFLAPPWLVAELAERLPWLVDHVRLSSRFGHDAFLKEQDSVGAVVRGWVSDVVSSAGLEAVR